jgi:hydrogenase maturation protein HypF
MADGATALREASQDTAGKRMKITVRGAVQGVGFRPFVQRLASELGLAGWVRNCAQGVQIEAEGGEQALSELRRRLAAQAPGVRATQAIEATFDAIVGYRGFVIRENDALGPMTTWVPLDLGICPECVADIFDPSNRRYRYAFATCCRCGPRYTILEHLPYARAATTMRAFSMCAACRAEFDDPGNRRFHAETNACPACGPQLALWDATGAVQAAAEDAIRSAARAIRAGMIVAVKSLGGFQLLADAGNPAAIKTLRQRKRRAAKPFAVMYPSLAAARYDCVIEEAEQKLLYSAAAPIVLLPKRGGVPAQDDGIAPGNPYLGVMLPYTPLHHLLLAELGFPVVATSGNLSDEPICTDERDALARLEGVADLLLVHDRLIAHAADDSVARVILGGAQVLRAARGFAPMRLTSPAGAPTSDRVVLGLGGQLKNTLALSLGGDILTSPHIGDLDTTLALDAFERSTAGLTALHAVSAGVLACDMHPDYITTRYGTQLGLPRCAVQHHHAHVLACMAENCLAGPALGVAWDGTGYGPDGTIWGGEFLRVGARGYRRVAWLLPFPLPGGDAAARQPRRSALGVLWAAFGEAAFELTHLAPLAAFDPSEREVLRQALRQNVNTPLCSSMGRLFDAVAAITGLRQTARFEGDAAMALEFAADDAACAQRYEFELQAAGAHAWVIDWRPMLRDVLTDLAAGRTASLVAAKFHNGLAALAVTVAAYAGEADVVLTGGCFHNRRLTEALHQRLTDGGFRVHLHRRVPPNDGGIAVGQVVAAMQVLQEG